MLNAHRLSHQVLLRCLRSELAWTYLPWDNAGKTERCYCLEPAYVVKEMRKESKKEQTSSGKKTIVQENVFRSLLHQLCDLIANSV